MSKTSKNSGLTRRGLLGGIALGAGGLVVGGAAGYAVADDDTAEQDPTALGSATEDCFGQHQAGIDTARQSNATLVALDLLKDVDLEALRRLMRLLTDDIVRLTSGRAALADPTAELATIPARLTVTVGFGAGLLDAAGMADKAPTWLAKGLPKFSIDELRPDWSGGDLLLQVAAEDPVTVSHAVRVLVTDARPFATVRWMQSGFHRPANTAAATATGRNLMGQIDGTVNPETGSDDLARVVWVPPDGQPEWLRGGTAVVVRRISIDLKTWGGMDQNAKEEAIGRRLCRRCPPDGWN